MAEALQPDLHDTLICVQAPLMAISASGGQIRGTGAHGYYLGDHRSLSRLILTVDDEEPTMLSGEVEEAARALFFGHCGTREASEDPRFVVERERVLDAGCIQERVRITNTDRVSWKPRVDVEIACEYAPIDEVKAGARGTVGTVHEVRHDVLGWRSYRAALDQESRRTPGTTVSAEPRADEVSIGPESADPPTVGRFTWHVDLEPGASWAVVLTVDQPGPPHPFPFERPRQGVRWPSSGAAKSSRPIDLLLRNSLGDLDALRLTTAGEDGPRLPGGVRAEFVAAGAPWYLTLFGRDSLWAARMLLPVTQELALGTLAMLSRYQGDKHGAESGERPGKIPHELRATPTNHGGALLLPPVYYGSVDATLLFIILMAQTWRHDQERSEAAIRVLLPALRAALAWLDQEVDERGRGFIAYRSKPGQLAHQGWKDSPDAVTFASGRAAHGPIALCEVQAYAYEAAVGAADLLEEVDGSVREARDWRDWAARLKQRFRNAFWIEDGYGRYPAIALDRDLRRVDGPSSNIGHLLNGDFLSDDEAGEVAALLMGPDLNSGWGIRTRSRQLTTYNPFGYHCGSVWPHDTAIAILGLLSRDPDSATRLANRLCAASVYFGHRLPELFAGIGADESPRPVPVSAACLPQAWAAASAVVIAQALDLFEPRDCVTV
ncbi:MAG TPA: glycogen debranching N-terminal domain-containing protein [Actinocrinis sp.]|nr:glycogen debranching N-terminal domain-containing protein [Actinocrinis sp.]